MGEPDDECLRSAIAGAMLAPHGFAACGAGIATIMLGASSA
jgi:hypothetical protein